MSSDRLEYVPLSDLAEINPRKDVRLTGESTPVSFIPMGDVSESGAWLNRQTRPLGKVDSGYTSFKEGDVLFAKITPCMENGKGCHARNLENGHGFGSTEFHVLRSIEGVSDARFLYHWTRTPMLRLKAESAMSGSAGQQRVSTWFFDEFKIPHIPLSEQRRIADVLDTVDAAIQETDSVVEKQEQVKTGLLQDLLTRGLDADGRLRDPEREPEAFRETKLGKLPNSWSCCELGDLTGLQVGYAFRSSNFVERGYPIVRMSNLTDEGLDLSEAKRIPEDLAQEKEGYRLKEGDLLIGMSGSIDKFAEVDARDLPCFLNQRVGRFKRSEKIEYEYLKCVVQTSLYYRQIDKMAAGAAQRNISKYQVESVLLPVPPLDEQRRILDEINRVDDVLQVERQYGTKLRSLKNSLMQDLLTGEVHVPEAEARVDEVVA